MTEPQLHVLALCGSLRRDSLNRRLMAAAMTLAPPQLTIIAHPIGRIPPYDADVEARGLPASVQRLKEAIDHSDGLLIVTPEYNVSIPGVLKNAIDWASRPAFRSPLVGKPVALIGATPGRGAAAGALRELRRVLESTLAEPLPDALGVAQAHEKLRGPDIVDSALADAVPRLLRQLEGAIRRTARDEEEEEEARKAAS
jgi:chromate reductase, NAD(P)H dehydrogenase (quinone)